MICSIASAVKGRDDSFKAMGKPNAERKSPDLEIYGPPGIRDWVRSSLALTASYIALGGFTISVNEFTTKGNPNCVCVFALLVNRFHSHSNMIRDPTTRATNIWCQMNQVTLIFWSNLTSR
jgi:hypothetical protein